MSLVFQHNCQNMTYHLQKVTNINQGGQLFLNLGLHLSGERLLWDLFPKRLRVGSAELLILVLESRGRGQENLWAAKNESAKGEGKDWSYIYNLGNFFPTSWM